MRKRVGSILWGIVFIVVGVGLVGDIAGAWEFQPFFAGWWTLFMIVPAFISLIQNGIRISNTIWLLIGLALLACCRGLIEWSLLATLFVPVIFIVIGLIMVMRNLIHLGNRRVQVPSDKKKSESVVFSGKKLIVEDEFYGMDCDAVFGGITLDLRGATITQNISIDALAVFGGVDILLPANVQVKLSDTSLFGGCSNHYHSYSGENIPVVYINATALFGGVEVK